MMLLAWWPLAFFAFWTAICTLLALLGGHIALRWRFPPVNEREEETFLFASGWAGLGVTASRALHVGIGAAGLHFAPTFPFRPFFLWWGVPCIPWTELRCVGTQPTEALWFRRLSTFMVPSLNLTFAVRGAAGLAIERKLAALEDAG